MNSCAGEFLSQNMESPRRERPPVPRSRGAQGLEQGLSYFIFLPCPAYSFTFSSFASFKAHLVSSPLSLLPGTFGIIPMWSWRALETLRSPPIHDVLIQQRAANATSQDYGFPPFPHGDLCLASRIYSEDTPQNSLLPGTTTHFSLAQEFPFLMTHY